MMWNLDKFSDELAIISEDGLSYSYFDLSKKCNGLASEISGRCLVFCLCSNEIGSLVGYLTFINNKIVPLLLDSDIDEDMLTSLIEAYKPDYLWVPNRKSHLFEFGITRYSESDYSLIKLSYSNQFALNDDLALLVTTSGSTGSPKLVRQSYANIRANTESIIEYLQIDESERPITSLPMHYIFGLSVLNTHLYVGASIVLTRKGVMEKDFWKQLKEFEVTSFSGVPYHYDMLNRLLFFRMELPALRTLTQAGGKLSPELHKKFAEYAVAKDKKFYVMYGATEATARMGYLPSDLALEKYGCMGRAIPGGEFYLIDSDGGKISEPNVAGELIYRGENVTLGYALKGSDLCKGDERNGELATGDIAVCDNDGFYTIVGRRKRFIKLYGNRINLDEIEHMLKAHFSELECACAGQDDALFIFATPPHDTKEIIHFLAQKTGVNSRAFIVQKIQEIPKNESGKTLYKLLEQYYEKR